MKQGLYKSKNNLFQSLNWLAFQENFGRKTLPMDGFAGVLLDLPFGKKFIWAQKSPQKASVLSALKLPQEAIFLRIEPGEITDREVRKYKLRKVTEGSLLSGQKSPQATRILDISKPETEILAQMKSKTRYNIRLAEKKGVVVKILDNEDILYDLLSKTANRDKGYAPHEKQYYTKMIKDLGRDDVAHIFVAEYKGEFLAAILVSFYGEVATYLHGGFNDSYRNLMAPYLCQWAAIKYAKSKGCKYYDFWGVAVGDDPRDPWAGITRFKEGFGGEKVVSPGAYDLVLNPFWYNSFTILAKLRKMVRH